MQPWKKVTTLGALAIVLAALAACGEGNGAREIALAPPSMLPPGTLGAPPVVQEAYRFALANAELLSAIPCYCGCGSMGHTSNLSCYVKQFRSDGTVEFDTHALG